VQLKQLARPASRRQKHTTRASCVSEREPQSYGVKNTSRIIQPMLDAHAKHRGHRAHTLQLGHASFLTRRAATLMSKRSNVGTHFGCSDSRSTSMMDLEEPIFAQHTPHPATRTWRTPYAPTHIPHIWCPLASDTFPLHTGRSGWPYLIPALLNTSLTCFSQRCPESSSLVSAEEVLRIPALLVHHT